MSGIRVLHVFHHIFHYHCGYRTRCEYILHFQRSHGLDPMVVTSADHEHGPRAAFREETCDTHETPAYVGPSLTGLREWALVKRLERQLDVTVRDARPDVIHAHSPVLVAWPALRAARRAGIPFIYEVRDLWENASVDLGKFTAESWRYRLARSADTHVLRQADAVIVLGAGMRRELHARGVRLERLHVVGNGVDADALQDSATERGPARQRWGLGDDPTIAYVGTFQPYEGLDLLLDALPAIRATLPARLVIAGDGREADRLRERALRRGITEQVTFLGRIPHHEVRQVYAAADLMVYPRLLTRTTALTTPLKPLEAMAAQTPVLASDVPALAELVDEGRTGWLFRAGDPRHLASRVIEILNDPTARRTVAARAHGWVRSTRQWVDQVSRYPHIYRSLIETNRGARCA